MVAADNKKLLDTVDNGYSRLNFNNAERNVKK